MVLVTLFLINSKFFYGLTNKKNKKLRVLYFFDLNNYSFFIALSLNTILSDINQKKNLVKVLDATNLSLENSEMKTQGMFLNADKKGADI